MNQKLLLTSTLLRLGRSKIRTLLMGLGIIVSVLATVLIMTAEHSFRLRFAAFIQRAYPADSVILTPGSGAMGGSSGATPLRLSDIAVVASSITQIRVWDPLVRGGSRDLKNGANNTSVSVVGVSENAPEARRRSVEDGEPFTPEEVRARAHVALIGSTTARKLFPGQSALGETVFVDNIPFKIKGVLESVGVDPHGNNQDDTLQVPYTTLLDEMLKADSVNAVTFLVRDGSSQSESVAREIAKVMRERHGIGPGQQDDFSIMTPTLMQALVARSFQIFDIFVPVIAGTAFLISGLVILSIMLISIRERTAEIGLRKAVGARRMDLQVQFVLEVLIVAVMSSVVGLVLVKLMTQALGPLLAAKFGIRHFSATPGAMALGVCAAVVTGLIGALVPARRAAKLDPVEALR